MTCSSRQYRTVIKRLYKWRALFLNIQVLYLFLLLLNLLHVKSYRSEDA